MAAAFQLLYASTAAKNLRLEDLPGILEPARQRNQAAGITGLLLYADRNFIQVLEGEEADVDKVFAAIQRDPRHTGVMVLMRRTVAARNFSAWSMGFEEIRGPQPPALDAIFKISRAAITDLLTEADSKVVMSFLGTFYQVATRDIL